MLVALLVAAAAVAPVGIETGNGTGTRGENGMAREMLVGECNSAKFGDLVVVVVIMMAGDDDDSGVVAGRRRRRREPKSS